MTRSHSDPYFAEQVKRLAALANGHHDTPEAKHARRLVSRARWLQRHGLLSVRGRRYLLFDIRNSQRALERSPYDQ